MNQSDLVRGISERTGQTLKDTKAFVTGMVETIQDALRAGDVVRIQDLGMIFVREKKPRTGYNPRTKQPIQIPGRKVALFRAVPSFRELVS